MEQCTVAQLLRVFLAVVPPARTQITGLSYACAWVHIENPFSLSCA